MAQDFLSQEEVDALLKGVSGEADEAPAEAGDAGSVDPTTWAARNASSAAACRPWS
jgi:flagellar motor switch protein FliM